MLRIKLISSPRGLKQTIHFPNYSSLRASSKPKTRARELARRLYEIWARVFIFLFLLLLFFFVTSLDDSTNSTIQ